MQIQDSTRDEIDAAVTAASQAADGWAQSSAASRARLLRALANAMQAHRNTLVDIASEETSLGADRLNNELDRTVFQLGAFADHVLAGGAFTVSEDIPIDRAPPLGRPHLVRVRVPVGPVAMFSASNFPLAFSVLGGDTASAFAAGCPVVVKAHPGHPRLSRYVFDLARSALGQLEYPAGLLGMVEGAGIDVGVTLVRHPDIAAVAFTGSYKGGVALWEHANARPRPIPFYGELGSINPVVALRGSLADREDAFAQMLANSMEFGCGQICTSPGLLVLFDDGTADKFEAALRDALEAKRLHAMLTPGMKRNYDDGVARLFDTPSVQPVLRSSASDDDRSPPRPVLAKTDARNFVQQAALHEEIFGPACLLVRVTSTDEIEDVLKAVGGTLTVTLWGAETASNDVQRIARCATGIAGRVLFGGVPTGVSVAPSQHHGGPWPASTQPFTTSVGYDAINRFLRPVTLQSPPAWVLERQGLPC